MLCNQHLLTCFILDQHHNPAKIKTIFLETQFSTKTTSAKIFDQVFKIKPESRLS